MKGVKKTLLFLSLIPLSLALKANEPVVKAWGKSEPILQGSITDASTKKPVAGVLISICSKNTEKKEYTTDASGNFKVSQMAAGEVTIILEKKGYKTFRREGVIIKEGLSIKLTFDIKSEDRGEENDYFHPMIRMMEG
jgi:hypothetical protein